MAGAQIGNPKPQFFDASGNPLVGGTLTVYLAGTTTLTNTWQDRAQSTLNTNPITLDARGECSLWLDSLLTYKFVLKNAAGVEQWTYDNIVGNFGSAANVTFLQSGTGAVSRNVQDRLRDFVYVTDFMTAAQIADCRSFTGSLDVTDAIQAAVDSSNAVFFPPGTYRVVCKSTSVFDYGNATNDVFRAVDINKNNLTLLGHHATIRVIGYDQAGTSEINYAFSTAKNMNIGDVVNFKASGLKFDFDPTGDGSSTKRSFYFGGVEGIVLDDITLTSSGTRAGGTMTFQQCRSIRIDNFTLKNCTQGMNFSYCYDIVGSNWRFDNFSEAVDFDRVVFGMKLSNLVFRNATGGQCLDLNSVQDVSITGINVDGVGNVAIVNYKDTTQATYADYVSNAAVGGVFTISKNVTLQQITGRDCAGIQLGLDRTAGYAGGGPLDRIILRDVHLVNVTQAAGAPLRIEDVKNFVVENVYMENCTSTTNTSWGAVTAEADTTYADAHLSGTFRNVRINGCNLKGFRVSAPSRMVFDGVEVENFNTSNTANHGFAYDLQTLNNRDGLIYIDRTLAKTGQNSPVAWRFTENGAGVVEPQIFWGDGNRIDIASVSTPVAFGTAGMNRRIKKRVLVPIGTFSLASGTKDFPLLRPGEGEGMYLCYVSAHVTQDWAGHATDYLTTDVRTVISAVAASVATANFTAALTAGAEKDLGVVFNETAVKLAEGDIALLRIGRNAGTPSMEGLMADCRYIDYGTS